MLKSSTVWHVIYSPPIRKWLKFKAWYIMAEIIEIPAISDVFCVVLRGVEYNQTCRQCAPWLVGGAAYVSWGPWSHSANQVLGCDLCSFDNFSPALPASYPFGIFGHLSASWRRAYSNYSSLSVLIYAYLFILVYPGILCFQLEKLSWIAEALPGSVGYHPATWTCHRMSLCVKIKQPAIWKTCHAVLYRLYRCISPHIYIYTYRHYL